MRVTVQLDQTEIIKAIRFYLQEDKGVPSGPFPIELFFKDEKIEQGAALRVSVTFEAEHFTDGPYR